MIHAKYVLIKVNKNLSKPNVIIKYAMNVLNNYSPAIILKSVQYVENDVGLRQIIDIFNLKN